VRGHRTVIEKSLTEALDRYPASLIIAATRGNRSRIEDGKEADMKNLKALTRLSVALVVLIGSAATARAIEISGGVITTTLTIFDDTDLVGDVTCAVPLSVAGPNPCIAFGADHIKLRLNGHTITGPATPPTGCSVPTDTMWSVGIEALDRTDVKIVGPGIIQQFPKWGILLGFTGHSSSNVTVKKVTVYNNCWSGMQTVSTSDSIFEDNVFVNDAGGSNGASCGGT